MGETVEARFIGMGPLPAPARALCVGAPERRMDLYVDVEHAGVSLKVRGAHRDHARIERKELQNEWQVPAGDRDARCQRWEKRTIPTCDLTGRRTVEVAKWRWRNGRLDLVELDVRGERHWSVALCGATEPTRRDLDRIDALLDGAAAVSCAYSTFVLAPALLRVR